MSLRSVLLLKVMEDIVKYLDSSGQLLSLENAGFKYKNILVTTKKAQECKLPFRFTVKIDLLHLINVSGLCGQLILAEPMVAKHIIQDVIHLSLETLVSLPVLGKDQVQTSIRLQSFPSTFMLIRSPQLTGLVLMEGILVARTTTVKYTCSMVYRCPSQWCGNHAGVRRVGETLLHRAQCKYCSLELEELPQGRETGDQVLGYLLSPRALRGPSSHPLSPVLTCFRDDLAEGLELGVCYSVVGCHDRHQLLAWQVWRQPSPCKCLSAPLPSSVLHLHNSLAQLCPYSPWAFVVSLASQLASNMYPAEAFLHLKIGLFLSLASQDGCAPVPVLAVGQETSAAHILLEHAGWLADRYVPLTAPGLWSGVGGITLTDDLGTRWSEAGALLLAATGVCNLGDWAALRQPALRAYIFSGICGRMCGLGHVGCGYVWKALESGSVAVEVGGTGSAVPHYPLRSAIWTYTSLPPSSKHSDTSHLKTLIDVFGIPFLAEVGTSAEQMTQHLLRSAVNGHMCKASIPHQELQEYIGMVKWWPVKLSDMASRLIRNYFVASRRLRPHCLPVGAVNTITRLSEAWARLALQQEVSPAHVMAVLFLYEEAMTAVFGPCLVTPRPPPLPTSTCPCTYRLIAK